MSYGQQFPPPDDPYQKKYTYEQQYGRMYEWQEAWQKAVTEPSPETFQELIADPNANTNRAMTWIFVVGLIIGLMSVVAQAIFGAGSLFFFGGSSSDAAGMGGGLICGVIMIPIIGVLFIIGSYIAVGIQHLCAKILGGDGNFADMYYAYATYTSPLTIISSLVSIIPILGALISIPIGIYQLVLNVIALKAVYKYGWFQAVLTFFLPAIVIGGLVFCCIIALAGSIESVFDNINSTLEAPQ
ncbi:MAG: YIP1 family protein [Chloroflexi bacterium]|nr:YIP1 family protein [Chloroflexota bacterium]